jgi:transaldolase
MPFLLDSAWIPEAETASTWGWVEGITTNPTLLSKSGISPEETLRRLAELTLGPVFYQLVSQEYEAMLEEARRAGDILGDQLVIKILPTPAGFQTAAHLAGTFSCAITGIYSPAQALVAEAAGARFAIIYYHRAISQMPEGAGRQLLDDCVTVLSNSETHLLAASIKSIEEVITLRRAGVEYLTLPFQVLESLMHHPLSEQTGQDFLLNGVGLLENV